ncbi:hypothetical protein Tco_0684397 [Tanacetum coccineum]
MAYSRESSKPELFVVHPGSVAVPIKDRKCKTRGGSSRPPVKRKLALGSSTSMIPLPRHFFERFHNMFKNHLDNHMDVELLDLHDHCYARQAVVANAVNSTSRELLQVIEKLRGEFDVMKDMKRAREEECEELRAKFEAAMTEFEKNPWSQKWASYQQSLSTLELKVTSLEAEKARLEVVELVHSDDMGSLVGRLVSFAILYVRCRAYEQVADIKEPFNLSKMSSWQIPWLLIEDIYCQHEATLYLQSPCSFMDSRPLAFFSKSYRHTRFSLQPDVYVYKILRFMKRRLKCGLKLSIIQAKFMPLKGFDQPFLYVPMAKEE